MWSFDANNEQVYQRYAQAYHTGDVSNIDPNEARGNVQQVVQNGAALIKRE